MRCPYERVYYVKSAGSEKERSKLVLPREHADHVPKKSVETRRVACPGTLVVSVAAIDEPDYHSDHYAVLEVNWSCTEKHEVILFSKETMHPIARKGRPLVPFDKYNLDKWLQARINEIEACEVG